MFDNIGKVIKQHLPLLHSNDKMRDCYNLPIKLIATIYKCDQSLSEGNMITSFLYPRPKHAFKKVVSLAL